MERSIVIYMMNNTSAIGLPGVEQRLMRQSNLFNERQ